MSARDLAYQALDYINVATLADASARQKSRLASDLTATFQEIYSQAPTLYRSRLGSNIAAPITVSVTVTAGAKTLTCGTALQDGSTILIAGDPNIYNEVRFDGTTKTLVFPFNGLTGTYSADVWNDVITLDTTVDRVTGNVMLDERYRLVKANNRSDALFRYLPEPDYGRRLRSLPSNRGVQGQPASYWVEASLFALKSTLRMHVYPLPKKSYTLGYDVRHRAPRFATGDLGTDGADSTVALVVAADMVESIVTPLFLERWAGSAWFRDKEGRDEIKKQAEVARGLLAQYRPQQQSNRRLLAPL